MKQTFEKYNEPETVKTILSSLRKDNHLSKTFEGTAKNGLLNGFYTNLALINGMVIGYVKIKGKYDLDKGNLSFQVIPSKLYWVVILFCVAAVTVLNYKAFTEDKLIFIGSCMFTFMALFITIAYLLEGRSFLNHIRRTSEL